LIETITKETFSEVYAFLELLGTSYIQMLPEKIYEMIIKQKSDDYKPVYDINIPLEQQILKKETWSVIAYLDINYWCNKNEKKKIKNIFYEKEIKAEAQKRKKYNPNDLFPNKTQNSIDTSIIEYKKENFWKKLFNKIKKIFTKVR